MGRQKQTIITLLKKKLPTNLIILNYLQASYLWLQLSPPLVCCSPFFSQPVPPFTCSSPFPPSLPLDPVGLTLWLLAALEVQSQPIRVEQASFRTVERGTFFFKVWRVINVSVQGPPCVTVSHILCYSFLTLAASPFVPMNPIHPSICSSA